MVVIQFAGLEGLVAEIPPGILRVSVLEMTESASSQIPGLRLAGIGVHVRTTNGEVHILACYLPVASVEVYEAAPRGSDPAWKAYEDIWAQAEVLRERVMANLTEKGCSVTGAGVIHLGGMQPLPGTWSLDPGSVLPISGGHNGDLRLPHC